MSTYQFNSPIGYSKKPLFYDDRKITNTSINNQDSLLAISADSNASLDKLPQEILSNIIHQLDQFDSFKLLQTSRLMYNVVRPKLYENIIIDLNFSEFNKEFNSYKYQYLTQITHTKVKLTSTFIKSSYNLKRFLGGYNGQSIRRLQCINLPDSFNVMDHDINELIVAFFKSINGLHELIWLPDNFNLKVLEQLNGDDLVSLIINIKFNHQELKILKQFTNLINFQIGPYSNNENLLRLIKYIDFNKLNVLVLTKFAKKISIPDPPSTELVVDDYSQLRPHEINDLQVISKVSLQNVTKLSIDGMIIKTSDLVGFQKSINLAKLVKLKLVNTIEVKEDSRDSFLLGIADYLTNLRVLSLDYREIAKDNVPEFLKRVKSLGKLDLIIRTNTTTIFNESEYSKALATHSHTLQHLSIEIMKENTLNFSNMAVDLNKFLLDNLQQLKSLRINSAKEIDNLQLVRRLPYLEYLHLFGLKAGGSPNLGLGMVHPSVFDEWFKVQHVALIYLNNNEKLKYIKINQCIFECNDKAVTPRDGIDHWFDEIIRVSNLDLV